jgi:hypothetical protein
MDVLVSVVGQIIDGEASKGVQPDEPPETNSSCAREGPADPPSREHGAEEEAAPVVKKARPVQARQAAPPDRSMGGT